MFRSLAVISCLLTLALSSLAPPPVFAQDWGVRRDPFDKALIRRYKRILETKPSDSAALGKLMGLYRRHRTIALLIQEYQSVHGQKPSFSNSMVLGYLQQHTSHPDVALTFFAKAAQFKPTDPDVHTVLGALYHKTGQLGDAQQHYSTALKFAKSKATKLACLRALADIAMTEGHPLEAQKRLQDIIGLDPKNLHIQLELGEALAQHKRYDEAIELFGQIEKKLRSDPMMRVEVITKIGDSLRLKGQDLAAVQEYERGIQIVGRAHYLVKDLTARMIEIFRSRQEIGSLIAKLEKRWKPKQRGHFQWNTLAQLYEEAGQSEKAISAYQKATQKAPYELDTQRRFIVLLENSGLRAEARKQYEVVIRIAPGEARFQLDLAKRYWKIGNTQKALKMARKIESRFSRDAGVIGVLADLYNEWGKRDQALAAYKKLTTIEANDPQHIENLGEQYFQHGDKDKAQQIWKKLIRTGSAQNYARLAKIYSEHDILQDAIVMYAKAIELSPKTAEYYKGRANVFERLRVWKASISDWNAALGLIPDKKSNAVLRQEARRRIVNLLYRSGKHHLHASVRQWSTAFARTPPDLAAGYFLVEAYERQGEVKHQQDILLRLLSMRPNENGLMTKLVKTHRSLREYDKAVSLLLTLAKNSPGREREYFTQIAEIKTDLQEDGEAIEYVRRALEKSPNDPIAYQRLAERYQAMQQQDKAVASYEKVLQLAPRTFPVYFTLARLYINRGERDKASLLFRYVINNASEQEILRKAGQEAIELEWLNGTLPKLETILAPLVIANSHKPIYRRLLVRLYARYVPILVGKRNHSDSKEKDAAANELLRLGGHGLRPLLEALADEEDIQQQRIAVSVLGFLGNTGAAAPLIRLAQSESTSSLQRLSASAPKVDWKLRIAALVAAGRLGAKKSIPQLVHLSTHDELSMREAAVFGLGKTGDSKALPALLAATTDKRHSVQSLACLAMGTLAATGSNRATHTKMAAAGIAIVADQQRDDRTRAACAWLLGIQRSAAGIPTLHNALEEGSLYVQQLAAWALGQIADKRSVPHLITAYFSLREPARNTAALALQSILSSTPAEQQEYLQFPMSNQLFDETAAIEALVPAHEVYFKPQVLIGQERHFSVALSSTFHKHRDLILRALEDLDASPSGIALGALTIHSDTLSPKQQAALRKTLQAIGNNLPELVYLTQHRDPDIRKLSLNILAKIGGDSVLALIDAAAADETLSVRVSAIGSAATFANIHSEKADKLRQAIHKRLSAAAWQERVAATVALGQWPHNTIEELGNVLLQDNKGFVRVAAAKAIQKQLHTQNAPETRQQALEILKQAVDAKRELLQSVRIAAIEALHALGGNHAQQLIQRIGNTDPNSIVRKAAKRR